MGPSSVMIFFALLWFDRGASKSIRYRGTLYKSYFAMFPVCLWCSGTSASIPPTIWGSLAIESNFLDTRIV